MTAKMLPFVLAASSNEWFGPARSAFAQASTNGLLFILWLLGILAASICAFIHARLRKQQNPDAISYTWGFFVAYYLLLWPVFLGIAEFGKAGATMGDFLGAYVGAAILFSIAGVFVLKQLLPAFVVGSLLTLNPIFWIGSVVYYFKCGRFLWDKSKNTSESTYILHDGVEQLEPLKESEAKSFIAGHPNAANLLWWNEKESEWQSATGLLLPRTDKSIKRRLAALGAAIVALLLAIGVVFSASKGAPSGVSDVVSATPMLTYDASRVSPLNKSEASVKLFATDKQRRFHGINLFFEYPNFVTIPDGQFEHFYIAEGIESFPFPVVTLGVWDRSTQKLPAIPPGTTLTKDQARTLLPPGAGLYSVMPVSTQGVSGSLIKFSLPMGDPAMDGGLIGWLFFLQTSAYAVTLQSLAPKEAPGSVHERFLSDVVNRIASSMSVAP